MLSAIVGTCGSILPRAPVDTAKAFTFEGPMTHSAPKKCKNNPMQGKKLGALAAF
jgi:hypothetical protein